MTTFVSKPVEIEAMHWTGADTVTPALATDAERIVAWVNANGGEAHYQPPQLAHDEHEQDEAPEDARILVRTNSGWAPVAPGWWIVKGSETFDVPHHHSGTKRVLDHYLCDPDTFAKRWKPAGLDTGPRKVIPTDEVADEAVVQLVVQGILFHQLVAQLRARGLTVDPWPFLDSEDDLPTYMVGIGQVLWDSTATKEN